MSLEFLISKIQKNNFLLIGRAGVDIYPDPPGTKTENAINYVTHLGGSSANMGVQLTRYGGSCSLLTRVSNDALGKFALNQLDHYGVKRNLIKLEDKESRISFAIVESRLKEHQSMKKLVNRGFTLQLHNHGYIILNLIQKTITTGSGSGWLSKSNH